MDRASRPDVRSADDVRLQPGEADEICSWLSDADVDRHNESLDRIGGDEELLLTLQLSDLADRDCTDCWASRPRGTADHDRKVRYVRDRTGPSRGRPQEQLDAAGADPEVPGAAAPKRARRPRRGRACVPRTRDRGQGAVVD